MKTPYILSLLLAMALVVVCGRAAITDDNNNLKTQDDMEDIVMKNILTRTSIRAYEDKKVEKEKIEKLLRAGMAAPTAVNRQPWHFIVVTDRDVLKALAGANPNAGMVADAPLAIVVCGDMNKALEGKAREYWIQDASAATENILLAAHGMGLGAVWTGTYPSEERCKTVSEVLKLPESIIPLNTIVIGYPAETPEPKDKFDTSNISYNMFGGKDNLKTDAVTDDNKMSEGLKEFDVKKELRTNPFTFFTGHGLLVAAGDKTSSNAMTIGWGALGNLWGEDRATVTVFVAPKRHTFTFMEKSKYFTIMQFSDNRILDYMGSHSGRDSDKAKDLGLHTKYTENGTPYYEEADMVIECEIMYSTKMSPKDFKNAVPVRMYSNFPAGVHSMYIGEVVKAMKK